MSYPPPPGAPVPTANAKPRLRGRIPLRLAIVFLVLGVAGIAVGAVVAYNGALKKVDSFQRIVVPAASSDIVNSKKIDFGTGGYIAYYESRNANSSGIPAIPIRLTSPSGKQQILDTPYGGKSGGKNVKGLSYDYDGHKGVALWQFTITEPGTYTVEVAANTDADPDASVAFGRSIGTSTAIGAVLVVLGVLLFVAGVILLIIGLVKRSRSKRELTGAQAYYGQPGAYPPAQYGGPTYGQPGPYGGGPTYAAPPAQPYGAPTYGPPAQPGGYPPPPPAQEGGYPPPPAQDAQDGGYPPPPGGTWPPPGQS